MTGPPTDRDLAQRARARSALLDLMQTHLRQFAEGWPPRPRARDRTRSAGVGGCVTALPIAAPSAYDAARPCVNTTGKTGRFSPEGS